MIDYSNLNSLPELYSDCESSENDSDYEQDEEVNYKIDPIALQQNSMNNTIIGTTGNVNNNQVLSTTLRTEKDKLMLLVVKLTIQKLINNSSLHNNLHKFLKDLIVRSKLSFQNYLKFLTLLISLTRASESTCSSLSLTEFKKKILFLLIISDDSKKSINNWSKVSGYPREKLITDLNHFKLVNELCNIDIDKKELNKTSFLVKKELNKFIKSL